MDMRAPADHPILDAIAERWSPYAYDLRPVDAADLAALFEAARWSPSSYNEQPWRFVAVARDDPAFERALDCLVEANRAWARDAGVLCFAVAAGAFARNGKPNIKACYDLGQSVALLSVEASARGLAVHQMGGFDPAAARAAFGVPEGYEPVTAFTVGYPAAPNEGGASGRKRRSLDETVFGTTWGVSAGFLDDNAD